MSRSFKTNRISHTSKLYLLLSAANEIFRYAGNKSLLNQISSLSYLKNAASPHCSTVQLSTQTVHMYKLNVVQKYTVQMFMYTMTRCSSETTQYTMWNRFYLERSIASHCHRERTKRKKKTSKRKKMATVSTSSIIHLVPKGSTDQVQNHPG